MSKEHFVNKSNTPEAKKDRWRTPIELFNALNTEFDFDVDICASEDNYLLPDYFNEQRTALTNEWNICTRAFSVFMNPPYSQTKEFIERAVQQAKSHNVTVVALVNANTDAKWFADAVKTANEIRLITGRVSFVSDSGGAAGSNTKGQCLIIWRGKCETPCNITMINRDDYYKT